MVFCRIAVSPEHSIVASLICWTMGDVRTARRKQRVQRYQSLGPTPRPHPSPLLRSRRHLRPRPPPRLPVKSGTRTRVRDQVPHDDGRRLVQTYDHALYNHLPGQLDAVQDRHACGTRLPHRHRARHRLPRCPARAHEVHACEHQRDRLRERQRRICVASAPAFFVVSVTGLGADRRG